MSSKLQRASAIAVAASFVTALISANGNGAAAQSIVAAQPTQFTSQPVVQPLPSRDAADADALDSETQPQAASLAELVEAQPQPDELGSELKCLAGAIYYEAKGESLDGQLAVGRVVVARAKSGRFPDSYCGVVFQPSQFSFVRGNSLPTTKRNPVAWRRAVAIAQIANDGSWRSPAEGALYFHAARLSPGWRHTRVVRIDNHIFYR